MRGIKVSLLTLIVACLATSACSGATNPDTTTASTTLSTQSVTRDTALNSLMPTGAVLIPTRQLDTTALPADYPATAWTQNGGRTLGVIGMEGGCGKASVEIAEQSSSQLRVILVETVPREPQPCTMDIRYPPLIAQLDAPLENRLVVLSARRDTK